MGVISSPYTLDTTYLVLLSDSRAVDRYPDDPERWGWHFESGEYDSTASVRESLVWSYGGWFAEPGRHRIVEVTRRVMDPDEVSA